MRINSKARSVHLLRLVNVVVMSLLMLLTGCRQSNPPPSSNGVQMTLVVQPSPPTIGETTFIVAVNDEDGNAVDVTGLQVRGDMLHGGMKPEFGEAASAVEGEYHIPFEWTMSGDWIVTITADLPDGKTVEKMFELTVGVE